MDFNYELGTAEYVFMVVFVLLYAIYMWRTARIARQLNTAARAIVIKFFLRSFYLVLLFVCLMGPSFGESEESIETEGKDVYVLIDISYSMNAADIAPTRLEKVKFELQNLFANINNSRFGIITFSNDALMQLPLTTDRDILNLFVQNLHTNPSSGTDVCSGLTLCLKKIVESKRSNTVKNIILFTDGEDFGDCNNQMLNTLRRFGVQVSVVGVGTSVGGRLAQGNGWVKDNEGNIVVSKLKSEYLQRLSQNVRGQYFEITNRINQTSDLVSSINGQQNKSIETKQILVISNKYRYVLFVVLILVVLDVLVTITTFRI